MNKTNEQVQNYYGKELQTSSDLKTNACCTLTATLLEKQGENV